MTAPEFSHRSLTRLLLKLRWYELHAYDRLSPTPWEYRTEESMVFHVELCTVHTIPFHGT